MLINSIVESGNTLYLKDLANCYKEYEFHVSKYLELLSIEYERLTSDKDILVNDVTNSIKNFSL